MPNGLPIDIKTFRALKSQEAKLDALFDVLVVMHSAGYECETDRESRLVKCEDRFRKLEARKKFDTSTAGFAGFVGGAAVWAMKWILGK
jgi:hypothetical protein